VHIGLYNKLDSSEVFVVAGNNSLEIDLIYFCEIFRTWNFLRNGLMINMIPAINELNISSIIFNYFSYIRKIICPDDTNNSSDEIK